MAEVRQPHVGDHGKELVLPSELEEAQTQATLLWPCFPRPTSEQGDVSLHMCLESTPRQAWGFMGTRKQSLTSRISLLSKPESECCVLYQVVFQAYSGKPNFCPKKEKEHQLRKG